MHALLPSNPWRIWDAHHDATGACRGPEEPPPRRMTLPAPRRLPPCPTCGHAPIDDEGPAVASAGPSD
jgi:hypothetical protein